MPEGDGALTGRNASTKKGETQTEAWRYCGMYRNQNQKAATETPNIVRVGTPPGNAQRIIEEPSIAWTHGQNQTHEYGVQVGLGNPLRIVGPCLRFLHMRILLLLLLMLAALLPAQKSVHVRTYTRKDGTVVQSHTRAAPRTKSPDARSSSSSAAPAKRQVAAVPPTKPRVAAHDSALPKNVSPPLTVRRNTRGRIVRSATARRQFEANHVCPSTGRSAGACPGYVIDHVNPLACGGADAPSNMSWQTVAAAKEKDRWERSGCAVGR